MFDLRPVGYVIGLLVTVLGAGHAAASCWLPWPRGTGAVDRLCRKRRDYCNIRCFDRGGLRQRGETRGLSIQQTFLLTTGVWLALPLVRRVAVHVRGHARRDFTDAFFEAMSGLTTTGSTVFSGLDDMPKGLLLWRGILQWLGGIGIIVVAMVFLPELRVGGMQIFRSEGFDTFGKILPRATEISSRISVIYLGLTLACAFAYLGPGMNAFDATVHAMTTIATGGLCQL